MVGKISADSLILMNMYSRASLWPSAWQSLFLITAITDGVPRGFFNARMRCDGAQKKNTHDDDEIMRRIGSSWTHSRFSEGIPEAKRPEPRSKREDFLLSFLAVVIEL